MSTDTSLPQPRVSGLDVSDSALLATLLREAPIGFAFFGPDLRVRRINQTLARLDGLDLEAHLGLLPSEVWPGTLASRVESAVRHVLADGQPLFESSQPASEAESAAARSRLGQSSLARRKVPRAPIWARMTTGGGRSPGSPRMTRTGTWPAWP